MTPAKNDKKNRKYVATHGERSRAAYRHLKALALSAGYMAHSKDGAGFDVFLELLDAGQIEIVLRTTMKKPTPAQFKTMHAAGSAYYGQEWDTKRPELVSAVTKGRTTSSKHLTADECKTITDGINHKATAAST